MLIDLNEDTLQDLVTTNNKVVVQYSASWCGNCRIMKPKFKKLASENDGITFILVDAENAPESRKLANVSNLPTFAGFVAGNLVKQNQGNKVEIIQEIKDAVAGN